MKTIKNGEGCSYGRVLSQKVLDMKENMVQGFEHNDVELAKINANQTMLFNHMSTRMTKTSVAIWCSLLGLIGVLLGIIGGMMISHGI